MEEVTHANDTNPEGDQQSIISRSPRDSQVLGYEDIERQVENGSLLVTLEVICLRPKLLENGFEELICGKIAVPLHQYSLSKLRQEVRKQSDDGYLRNVPKEFSFQRDGGVFPKKKENVNAQEVFKSKVYLVEPWERITVRNKSLLWDKESKDFLEKLRADAKLSPWYGFRDRLGNRIARGEEHKTKVSEVLQGNSVETRPFWSFRTWIVLMGLLLYLILVITHAIIALVTLVADIDEGYRLANDTIVSRELDYDGDGCSATFLQGLVVIDFPQIFAFVLHFLLLFWHKYYSLSSAILVLSLSDLVQSAIAIGGTKELCRDQLIICFVMSIVGIILALLLLYVEDTYREDLLSGWPSGKVEKTDNIQKGGWNVDAEEEKEPLEP